jgi:integrase/recombinase XerC
VGWALDVEGVRSEAYRDTRGPGRVGFLRIIEQLASRDDAKGARDLALLRCLYDLGLRRAEACRLDVEDLDGQAGTLAVRGKGKTEKVKLTLAPETKTALEAWLAVRGADPGPLFRSLDRGKQGTGRLSGSAVYRIVRGLGERSGIRARPHGLRHASITEALDLTRGDVRAVQRFSRHRDVRILERYDDNRQDLAGEVSKKVAAAASLGEPQKAG